MADLTREEKVRLEAAVDTNEEFRQILHQRKQRDPTPIADKVREIAATVSVTERVRVVLFTADGRAEVLLDSDGWRDAVAVLVDQCESSGAPVMAWRAKVRGDAPAWARPGWRVRADSKRAEPRVIAGRITHIDDNGVFVVPFDASQDK